MKKIIKAFLFLLCLLLTLTFAACKEKDIYAESSDFQSYPDYWNSFNQNGDVIIPKKEENTTAEPGTTSNSDGSASNSTVTDGNSSADASSDDWMANFTSDDITDDGSTPSGSENGESSEPETNPDSSKDDTSGNQGPLVFF